LAYKIDPVAGPPLQAVPFAEQATTLPFVNMLNPGRLLAQTQDPAQDPAVLHVVGAVATQL